MIEGSDGVVEIRRTHGDDGATSYAVGIQSCGSVWGCACCLAKIRARRQIEVEAAAAAHSAIGGGLLMVTLTVRHDRAMGLAELLDALRESWRAVQRLAAWRVVKDRIVGTITALEVTDGPNGWHPHLHVLVLVEPGQSVTGELAAWLPGEWRRQVGRRFRVSPDLAHGVKVQELPAGAAAYVTKLAAETARADLKSDASNPWRHVDAMWSAAVEAVSPAARARAAEAVARWSEYVTATKGRRAIVWSRGLRARYLPDVPELTDEELAALEVDGELVEVVDHRVWLRECRTYDADGVLLIVRRLEAAELVLPEAELLRRRFGVRGSDPPLIE